MNLDPRAERLLRTRRDFLASAASGLGGLAVLSLMMKDGLVRAAMVPPGQPANSNPLAPRPAHFPARAKACIFIFLEGAPSQIDLFDPKPKLMAMDGQKLPESFTRDVRFAFIQKDTALVRGCPRAFHRHGQCGMEISELLPNIGKCADDIALIRSMHTEAFNHHPGQLLMNTGVQFFGRPSMGSWLTYGLGSESQDLPGYVVLTAGRGLTGGTGMWGSGFLPSTYQGVLFRNQGDPIVNLANPPGISTEEQRRALDAIAALNDLHYQDSLDKDVQARIAAYELAFRMQATAPRVVDIGSESQATLDAYGVRRTEGDMRNFEDRGAGEFSAFAANCLLARRLVENGVRFVNIYHSSWDHHKNLDKGLDFNCMMADQPIAALLADLKQRGLLDTTLVVWGAEFGRTCLGENRPSFASVTGRDHHPFAFSVWLAGGGVKGGQVIGATDEFGWNIVEDPVHVHDLQATMLHLFGLDHTRLTYRFQGRDFRLTDVDGHVVEKLLA